MVLVPIHGHLSSCQHQKKEKQKKIPEIFGADPSMLYTGDDIFPDSPLFLLAPESELCKLARWLRSLAREITNLDALNAMTRFAQYPASSLYSNESLLFLL